MAKTKLSGAAYVERGYGQVEPNHLSAQRTAQIYAQLPAASDIEVLENGQFVKYNYADGVCDFGEAENSVGEWMLVYNEVKVYRELEGDADFAMIKGNYAANIYSPGMTGEAASVALNYDGVITAADPYEVDSTDNPMRVLTYQARETKMPEGTTMVPRVFKTNIGDIFTTNTVNTATLAVGDILTVTEGTGYLTKNESPAATDMQWQVVKVYTLADRQKAVKIMRVA